MAEGGTGAGSALEAERGFPLPNVIPKRPPLGTVVNAPVMTAYGISPTSTLPDDTWVPTLQLPHSLSGLLFVGTHGLYLLSPNRC